MRPDETTACKDCLNDSNDWKPILSLLDESPQIGFEK